MRFGSWLVSLLLLVTSGAAQTHSPIIREIINSVNVDSLTNTVKILSGEVGSKNGGTSDTIYSRRVGTGGHDAARDYLKSKLESYGLSAQLQPYVQWLSPGTNVLAEQPGVRMPGKKYILCAHYDSYAGDTSTYYAPGADDNASGCAAVLEAARLLSRYQTAYTVVYAFWDHEEGGRNGSTYYAKNAAARGDTILGVINLDQIGWDGNGDSLMEIHTKPIANSFQLADTLTLVRQVYDLGLKPHVYENGSGSSDHRSFWDEGYTAVLLIEGYRGGDFSPHGHTTTDRIQYFNLPYFHSIARLALGSMAFLADVQGTVSVPVADPLVRAYFLEQNYPNPFNPTTVIRYGLVRQSHVKLTVFNTLGEQVATLVDGEVEPGFHEVVFNAAGLASGVYFYRLTVGEEHIQTKKLVLLH